MDQGSSFKSGHPQRPGPTHTTEPSPDEDCSKPKQAYNDDFVVIDTTGIHEVGLDSCACGKAPMVQSVQLLRYRLYPSTNKSPVLPPHSASSSSFPFCPPSRKARTINFTTLLPIEPTMSKMGYPRSQAGLTTKRGSTDHGWAVGALVSLMELETSPIERAEAWQHLEWLRQIEVGLSSGVRNGVGDLQKGKRYLSVNYILCASVATCLVAYLVISYDIACQCSRISDTLGYHPGGDRALSTVEDVAYPITKSHLPAHMDYCHRTYFHNFTENSTTEMDPGSRRDTLNDHFSDDNYKKIRTIAYGRDGDSRRIQAKPSLQLFRKIFLTSGFILGRRWWLIGRVIHPPSFETSLNPLPRRTTSGYSWLMKQRITMRHSAGTTPSEVSVPPAISDPHPSIFIAQGLQLEDERVKLRSLASALGLHPTSKQLAAIAEKFNTLRLRTAAWFGIQKLFMLIADLQRQAADNTQADGTAAQKVCDIQLLLPSSLPESFDALKRYEARLRHGRAHVQPSPLPPSPFLPSQAQGSAQNAVLHRTCEPTPRSTSVKPVGCVKLCCTCRRWSRSTPTPSNPLKNTDVRGISEGLYGETEGKRTISWIWEDGEWKRCGWRSHYERLAASGVASDRMGELLKEEIRKAVGLMAYRHEEKQALTFINAPASLSDNELVAQSGMSLSAIAVLRNLSLQIPIRSTLAPAPQPITQPPLETRGEPEPSSTSAAGVQTPITPPPIPAPNVTSKTQPEVAAEIPQAAATTTKVDSSMKLLSELWGAGDLQEEGDEEKRKRKPFKSNVHAKPLGPSLTSRLAPRWLIPRRTSIPPHAALALAFARKESPSAEWKNAAGIYHDCEDGICEKLGVTNGRWPWMDVMGLIMKKPKLLVGTPPTTSTITPYAAVSAGGKPSASLPPPLPAYLLLPASQAEGSSSWYGSSGHYYDQTIPQGEGTLRPRCIRSSSKKRALNAVDDAGNATASSSRGRGKGETSIGDPEPTQDGPAKKAGRKAKK
ncbi:hypothetical protein NMY22_g17430 [Coprinellus aureogranulatus]|nr:hypothetical protein NMY22_g17430 [Coprinellus aureogranulatus]